MLIFNFITVGLIDAVILIGLLGALSSYFIQYIPMISPYSAIIKAAGIILLIVGVYFHGRYDNDQKWQEKVTALENEIKISEQKSKEVNIQLSKALQEKKKVIVQKQVEIQETIKEVAAQIDSICVVSPEVINIINNSARKK